VPVVVPRCSVQCSLGDFACLTYLNFIKGRQAFRGGELDRSIFERSGKTGP